MYKCIRLSDSFILIDRYGHSTVGTMLCLKEISYTFCDATLWHMDVVMKWGRNKTKQ